MSVDVAEQRPPNGAPPSNTPITARHPAEPSDTLDAIRRAALELLAAFPTPPSSLRMRVGGVSLTVTWPRPGVTHTPTAPTVPPTPQPDPQPDTGAVIRAASVGVFYRAASPGDPPFVNEGDVVARGDQVGILEVMKLMIPVEADRAGRITRIVAADGQSVEYGEPLLVVDPSGAG